MSRFHIQIKKPKLAPISFSPSTNLSLSFMFKTLLLQDVLSRISHYSNYLAIMYESWWPPHYMGCTSMGNTELPDKRELRFKVRLLDMKNLCQSPEEGESTKVAEGFPCWSSCSKVGQKRSCVHSLLDKKSQLRSKYMGWAKVTFLSPILSQWKWESPSKSHWWAQVQSSSSWQWGKPNLQWSGTRSWQCWGSLPGQKGWGRALGWWKIQNKEYLCPVSMRNLK